jgi:hypothetical protein
MDAGDAQTLENLQAQLKMLQLQAQIEELERVKALGASDVVATSPPLPQSAGPPLPEMVTPPPPQAVTVPTPQVVATPPSAEELNCLTMGGKPIKCIEESDLIDPAKLFGGELPSFQRAVDALPSLDQLLQIDTLLPIVAIVAALSGGYFVTTAASEGLRPDDAATARRKREERERLGLTEEDEEQEERDKQNARDVWIQGSVAAALIVAFEVVLFNSRNIWGS